MLQQTRVDTVIPYYEQWIGSYPSVDKLALAEEDQVLSHWEGLGYYSRVINIHKTAKIIKKKNTREIFPKIKMILNPCLALGGTLPARWHQLLLVSKHRFWMEIFAGCSPGILILIHRFIPMLQKKTMAACRNFNPRKWSWCI